MTNYRLTPLGDTSENKKRIIEQARKKMHKPIKRPRQNGASILIAVLTLFVVIFLGGPYVQQAFFSKQNFTIEKVVFPNIPYDSLINSTYIDETNEFIYSTDNGFYSFDVANKQQSLIIETPNRIFDYAVSDKWLVWSQAVENELKIHSFNRQTHEIKVYESDYFYGIELKIDTLIFMGLTIIDGNSSIASYKMLDLNTAQTEMLREFEGGSNSRPTIDGSRIAISENMETESGMSTVITIQDFEKRKDIGNYVLPYQYVQNLLLKNNKVYGYMWNDGDDKPAIIGAIDIESGQFQQFKTSVGVDSYATDGEHFAIGVQKGDSNTVQLFENEKGVLKRISSLPSIKERLVMPRFTEQGTLIVNGEAPDRAMYIIRFE